MVLAVCAKDVKFYKWPSIDFMGAYEVPPECMSVKHISWCCDGKNILVVKSKGEPIIVKAPTKIENRISPQKCASLNNVSTGAFSKTNVNLLSLGMESGEVNIFNLDTKALTRYVKAEVVISDVHNTQIWVENDRYKRLPSGIQNLDFSYDCKSLLAGCFDGNIYLYDVKGRPTASFMVPNCYSLSTTLFSNYTNLLAGASKEGTLAIWNGETTDLLFSCKEHTARITDIAFLENTVTSVGTDGFLCIFDLRMHNTVSKCNLEGALSSLAYFSGSYDLAVGTYNQIRSYDIRNLSTPVRTLLINNGGHIKKIAAPPINLKELQQSTEKLTTKKTYGEDLSASGDFSIISTLPSEVTPTPSYSEDTYEAGPTPVGSQKAIAIPSSSQSSQKCPKTYKASDVKELEKFVGDYMKYMSTQYAEKMAQAFYALRINTSKQFICMGEKMDQSWNNFIAYLRFAGASEKSSSSESAGGSDMGKKI